MTRSWTIALPWSTPPVKRTRQTMGILARQAGIPPLHRCRVELTWFVADRIRRDVDNLAWTLKPLCDVLAGTKAWDHKIVPDDTPEWMEKPMPAIVYRPGEPKEMILTITEIPRTT